VSGSGSKAAFIVLLIGAVGIGFAPIWVRLSEVGPAATAFYRLLFALPFLWVWVGVENRRRPVAPVAPLTRKHLWQLAGAGLLFAGDLSLWHWSIQYTTVANATLFANLAPLFVTVGARMMFGEKILWLFVVGMGVTWMGAALLLKFSLESSRSHLVGDFLGIATALFYAGYMLSIKNLRRSLSTATVMAGAGLVSCPVFLLIASVSGETLYAVHWNGWLVLIALALISHVGGQSMIAYAFKHLPASLTSLSLLLQPLVAALLAWVILDEALGPYQIMGGGLVLLGIGLARWAQQQSS
jgi:drug/metabolite transporter (DMT)-like permease